MDVALWQFSNITPNFASVANAIICINILNFTGTGLVSRDIICIGVLDFFLEKHPHALIHASGSDI